MADQTGDYARELCSRLEREGMRGCDEHCCRQLVDEHMGVARAAAQATFGEGVVVDREVWRRAILDAIVARVLR